MRINGVWCVHKYDDKRQKVSYSVLRCVLLEKTREIFHIILHIVIHVETWNTFTKNYVRVCLYIVCNLVVLCRRRKWSNFQLFHFRLKIKCVVDGLNGVALWAVTKQKKCWFCWWFSRGSQSVSVVVVWVSGQSVAQWGLLGAWLGHNFFDWMVIIAHFSACNVKIIVLFALTPTAEVR